MIEPIQNDSLPQPNGHYVPAMSACNFIFTSVILPGDTSIDKKHASLEDQLFQLTLRLYNVLKSAGSSLHLIVKLTIYTTSIQNWNVIDQSMAKVFGEYKPARGIIHVQSLRYGYQVASDAIAVKK